MRGSTCRETRNIVKFVGSHKVQGENRLDRNFSPVQECLTGGMSSNPKPGAVPHFVLTAFGVSGTMTVDLFGSRPQAPHGLASNSPKPSKGKNDGLVGSFRYFTCNPKHGILAKPENVSPAVVTAVPNARKPSLTHVMVNSADDLYSPTPTLAPT